MGPSLIIFFAWLAFGGSHFVLSASPIRQALVDRFGARAFTIFFTGITCLTLSGLIVAVILYGGRGMPGLALPRTPVLLWVLGIISGLGGVLIIAGLINYPASPMAVLAKHVREPGSDVSEALPPPSAIEQVSRHPFFVGLFLFAAPHMLLATNLAKAVYFSGFVVMALMGPPLQDRKLRKRWADTYESFYAQTRTLPFSGASIHSGSIPRRGTWLKWILSALVAAAFLGGMHPVWKLTHGGAFAGFILLFGLIGVVLGLLARRPG